LAITMAIFSTWQLCARSRVYSVATKNERHRRSGTLICF
jgi:hypothetical protein